jgi:nitrite reductase/ring-hydroxylating ferredoxin subunit
MDDGVYTICGFFTHKEESLAEGYIDYDAVKCPRQGVIFNICSVSVKALHAVEALQTYSILFENIDIYYPGYSK